jgi:hypothetical protein
MNYDSTPLYQHCKFNNANEFINVLKNVYSNKYGFLYNLDELHLLLNHSIINESDKMYFNEIPIIGFNDRDSIFIKDFYNFIDNTSDFEYIYFNFVQCHIKPFFPNETNLVVQKTPNIRISFPELTAIGQHKELSHDDEVIGIHCDNDFGHSEEEINFIIPITDMFDTNSIYFEPILNSAVCHSEYNNLNISPDHFFIGYFNKLKHYNKINKTGKTRISLDFRIIPYSKYMEKSEFFKGTKFEIGNYFTIM